MAVFSQLIAFGCLLAALYFKVFKGRRIPPRGLKFPPGPPPKPLIGNLLDFPMAREWETYHEWAQQYGELVHINVLGKHMLFVNSWRMAYELFDKRSSIYSDRPTTPMIHDLMGFGWAFVFQPYGEWWRRHRKAMHDQFHRSVVSVYYPVQVRNTRELLRRLNKSPEDYDAHLHWLAGAIIMEMTYGIQVKPNHDPYVENAETVLAAIAEAGIPGRFLVDTLPFLKYVPEWFPGAGFKRKVRRWRQAISDMVDLPFEVARAKLEAGSTDACFVTKLLEDLSLHKSDPIKEDEVTVIKNTAGTMFLGGADTTVSAMRAFLLTMVLHPEVQRKAQKELDNFLGPGRLPEIEDMDQLPYIVAIAKETLRWRPLAPLGVPHCTSQEDIVDGYYIPKGTIVFGNIVELLHNEEHFGPDTDKFIPERHFNPDVRDPATTGAFGFERRACPGNTMAFNSLFIAFASILKVFNISNPRDENGKEFPVEYDWTSGFFFVPTPFKCTIKPRSEEAERLLL
ncbi:hypothetical protein M422DRAFT_267616 [Sphaerobolus stellatus SS14]|uniref:Cytochrome P450 n=1 Tax=Sphaerobolus stellatus (strain SS14) TaxID=990650 RepID=A0A0C9V028_SPHS4|nr:hypothetical protein M422DRAFT_267616 [Sphaerobolus stellatus SS14]